MGNSHGTLAILRQLDDARLVELSINADQRLDEVRGLILRRFSSLNHLDLRRIFLSAVVTPAQSREPESDLGKAGGAELQGTLRLCV